MKQAAFTLVELLVVISLILLLMGILLPSLQQSRQHAKAVLCSSNIKQLTLGLLLYDTENKTFPYGFYDTLNPPTGGYLGYSQYDRKGWWWLNYITDCSQKDSGRISSVWCPSRQIKDIRLKDNVLCANYGVNQSICKSYDDVQNRKDNFVGTPLGSSEIPRPGETLLITDSGYSVINWYHATDLPPTQPGNTIEDAAYIPGLWINEDRKLWPGQEVDAIYGRHPNKTVNAGFVDGHISRLEADDLFVEKSGDTYKNRCPLWLPR